MITDVIGVVPGTAGRMTSSWGEEAFTMNAYYQHPLAFNTVSIRNAFVLAHPSMMTHEDDDRGRVNIAVIPACQSISDNHRKQLWRYVQVGQGSQQALFIQTSSTFM